MGRLTHCATTLIVPTETERNDNVMRLVHEVCGAIAAAEQHADQATPDKKETAVAQTFNIEGAVSLPDATGKPRLWVGLRAPLLAVEGAVPAKAILLRVASLASSDQGIRFDGVATVGLGGRGIRELTLSEEKIWGIAGDVADSSTDNQLWHVSVSALRSGERIENVAFEATPVPSSAEGLAIDASSWRAFIVIDGDAEDCGNQPARQMTIDLRPNRTP